MTEEFRMLIQKLRLQRGWSQEQLAELSGLSVRTIQRLERGQTASVESLKALGAVFEVDFSDLREPAMQMQMSEGGNVSVDEALAFAQVRKIKGFYVHLVQYAIVIAALTILNIVTSPHYLWVVWVALGWGVGILAHALVVFDKVPFLNGGRSSGAWGENSEGGVKKSRLYMRFDPRRAMIVRMVDLQWSFADARMTKRPSP
jgi:transcriptional regulator with XRE-family HTH domain